MTELETMLLEEVKAIHTEVVAIRAEVGPALQAFDTAFAELQQRTTEFKNKAAEIGNTITRVTQAIKAIIYMLVNRNRTLATAGRRNSDDKDHTYRNLSPDTGSLQLRDKD